MSDRRRRRVNEEGVDENTDSDAKPRGERPSECESEEESGDMGDLSESESTADDGTEKEDDETEEGTDTETEGSYTEATDSETETEEGEDYTDEEGLDGERQSGDGQEQPEDDKPDDDEDRKNPAYVPRKGAFYEHDSRDGFEDAEDEKGEVTEQKKIKKLWQEEGKWGHDCYREDLQAPKSREELMMLYGYDILASDQPPEAPPVTKRGRGRGRKRDTRFNDYLPRMAVIDTTEYGADTVPSLDEDGMITFRDSKSVRPGRGRGSGRGGYNNNSPKFSGYQDDNNYNKPQQREATPTNVKGSQDARNDYPSLEETRGVKSNRDYNRDRGRDYPKQYERQSSREEQSSNYNYDRNDRKSTGSGRFSNNYDDDHNSNYYRKGDRNSGNNYPARNDARNYGGGNNRSSGDGGGSGFHQNYGDGGSNFNNRNDRRDNNFGGNNNNRQMESNWRRSEPTGGDNNRRVYQEQRGFGGSSRGRGRGDGGRSIPYDGGDDLSNRSGYNTKKKIPSQDEDVGMAKRTIRTGYDNAPPRHQHIDTREYTSSKIASGGVGGGGVDNRTISTPRPNQGPGMAGENNNNNSSSNNVVISNKENVQTINVTITSTTTEKKSYAKERRAKGATTIPKGGEPQQGSPAMVMGAPTDLKTEAPGKQQYPPHPVPGGSANLPMVPGGGAKRYSSQRQQQTVAPKAGYNNAAEKTATGLPVDQAASTLYNPALPPPSFFQHDSPATGGNNAPPPSGGPQDPQQRFNPSMLPPGNPALSFGLPVPTPGLPIPAPTGSPNMFQGPPASIGGPPAATGPPLIGPPFIAPGMMYGTSPTPNPRVPPPATPVGFPLPLTAYPTGPPPPPAQPPANVVPPVSQGATNSVPGSQQLPTKPKKVYRGDIIYYAPELQQPARTTQKRPKSAIPIVDPQEISQMKAMEKLEEQSDKSTNSLHSSSAPSHPPKSPPEGSVANTAGVIYSSDSLKEEPLSSPRIHPKEEIVSEQSYHSENNSNSDNTVASGCKLEGTYPDRVNNSVGDQISKAQTIVPQDYKEEQQVDAKVLSSLADLSIKQDPSSATERSGDAGRFIKGKSSSDIVVVDNVDVNQELSSSGVSQEGSGNTGVSSSQSSSETVAVKEEVVS